MNKIVFVLLAIGVLFFSCTTGQKGKSMEERNHPDVSVKSAEDEDQIIIPSDSGIVKVTPVDGNIQVRIRKKENQNVYIEFLSEGYRKVSAHLSSPDSLANIRFSQILLPDGTVDGPFGRSLEYQLPEDGIYRISVSENGMAGDPWSGEFIVHIGLSE